MGEFFKNAWAFVQTNYLYFIAGAVALIVLIIIISSISRSAKKRRVKAELAAKTAAKKAVPAPQAKPAAAAAPAPSPSEEQTVTVAEEKENATDAEPLKAVAEISPEVKDEKDVPSDEIDENTASEKVIDEPAETPPVEEEKPAEQIKSDEKTAPSDVKPAEKKVKAPSPSKPSAAKTQKKQLKNVGKWTVAIKAKGEYMATLAANNGEVMLSSETYTTEEGAKNGISTIINGVANGKFIVYCDKNGNYYYKLKSTGNRLLCVGEIYKSKDQCLKAVETVKRIAAQATVSDVLQKGTEYVEYTPLKVDGYEARKGLLGKWRVEKSDDGNYSAKLYASNGQLMLATEEVSLLKSAENAIEAVRKNSLAGNFIIDRDKFGRYYYKLRNAQKSVICIGEAYDTFDSCVSALESVRRFAATAVYKE